MLFPLLPMLMIDWQMNEQGSQRTVDCPAVFAPYLSPFELGARHAAHSNDFIDVFPSATRRTRGMLLLSV